jgi:SH3-like domain-containing protein
MSDSRSSVRGVGEFSFLFFSFFLGGGVGVGVGVCGERLTWRKQRRLAACVVYVVARVESPRAVANVAPWRRARCWTAMVKKDDPDTSSQRSKPVLTRRVSVAPGKYCSAYLFQLAAT